MWVGPRRPTTVYLPTLMRNYIVSDGNDEAAACDTHKPTTHTYTHSICTTVCVEVVVVVGKVVRREGTQTNFFFDLQLISVSPDET